MPRIAAACDHALALVHKHLKARFRARNRCDALAIADAGTSIADAMTAWATANGATPAELCPSTGQVLPRGGAR